MVVAAVAFAAAAAVAVVGGRCLRRVTRTVSQESHLGGSGMSGHP